MKKMLTVLLLPLLAACASGSGRVETAVNNLNSLDVYVAGSVAYWVYEVSGRSVWDAATSLEGSNLYRVTLKRHRFAEAGDGEAPMLFKRHAERIAASQSCAGYRIIEYSERYDKLLIGAQRVAEGLIECVKA